jgi:hypothetical protein
MELARLRPSVMALGIACLAALNGGLNQWCVRSTRTPRKGSGKWHNFPAVISTNHKQSSVIER